MVVKSILFLLSLTVLAEEIKGHGYLLEPPNRSSLWRFESAAPINYQDNQVFCGGAYVQHDLNGGRCGICGDNFDDPHPQDNENTGKFGKGIIARTYASGSTVDVVVNLTKNHLGSFVFGLCQLEDVNLPEPGEECFQDLALTDGSTVYGIVASESLVKLSVRLPEGKTCERCVLRWHYRSGNNWGDCGDGTWNKGCGPQETFRNCADVAIV